MMIRKYLWVFISVFGSTCKSPREELEEVLEEKDVWTVRIVSTTTESVQM